ncbi:hypothetical protein AXG93_977s1230 [Marchantia polymorpha subsp. ruderalis]|uniref:Uncharacterized protein n=1 Tax=Marchantia polymorpha subsp. ruderalis TaxID=1480154 RepID=A0A176WBL5_MARPO|nr:hypothetical protein AXG93_977s1230 [Marchantia polymorpha subsp. ruderalis]
MTSLAGPTALQRMLNEDWGLRPDHVHHANCPIIYQQPSLFDFWANPENTEFMHAAGLYSLLKFDHPQENDSFLESLLYEYTIADDGSEILCSPCLLSRDHRFRDYSSDNYAPILFYDVTDLQRLFPGLPSRETHGNVIERAPEHTDNAWLCTTMKRYFAVPILWFSPRGAEFIVIESCFNLEFFLFLSKLAYTFGWPGYPDKFPLRHFPMAVEAFERGAVFPWADLLLAELMNDLTKDNGQGFGQFHYHAEDISPFTPRDLLPMLNEGACRGPPNCPDDLESPTDYSSEDELFEQ